ncbi:MAG: aminotransferase class I/II-fold pyridoxal phosphate-dependent enzyme [Candidatus Micrarchaeota archaeon]
MTNPSVCEQSEIFKTSRLRERGKHLTEMRRRQFGKTPVNDRTKKYLDENPRLEVREMCFGDPSLYPDMGPYDAVHRFMRRYLNFHDNPQACASYNIWGDPQFVQQIRRGSAYLEDAVLPVPDHVAVYPTAGVAGALRMICPAILLPPGPDGVRDNVVVPKWTYLSHSAEAAFALADVRSCRLTRNGQVDLNHMLEIMDENTQAVILATVGNPLATAMSPTLFDEMMGRIHDKMKEYGHPIVVVADVIYEHFRRNRSERIDAIQRTLRLNLEIPIIETSSFSKMFGMAGYRLGFYRALWQDGGTFRDERDDFFIQLNTVYGPSLCPVPTIIQKAVGSLYVAINSRQPVEEELAPVAAVLTAVKDLTEKSGGGDTHTMMPEAVPEEILRRLGIEPKIWFTSSAIAKRTRKLANAELGKYNVDIDTKKVEEVAGRLVTAGFIEKRELEVTRKKMMDILTSSVINSGHLEHKLFITLQNSLRGLGIHLDQGGIDILVSNLIRELLESPLHKFDVIKGEIDDTQLEFGIHQRYSDDTRTVKLVFYKLTDSVKVPPLDRSEDGKLVLEGISGDHAWVQVAKKCKLPTEDGLYEEHKISRRTTYIERTDSFMKELDQMAREGLGIYLHPAVYDDYGNLVPERLNAFYVLFGFEKLKGHPCQAAELVSLCKELGLPLLAFTPGEVFLPGGDKEPGESFIRAVTLDSKEKMDEVLSVIRQVATYLAKGELITYRPGQIAPPSDLVGGP